MRRYMLRVDQLVNEIYGTVKRRASKKGLEFSLSKTLIYQGLRTGRCAQTGIPFSYEANSPWKPSLDRIDSRLGYTKENVQYVCVMYNYCKNDFSDEEVRDMCEALVKFQGGASG